MKFINIDQYKYWNKKKVISWIKYDYEMNNKFSFITNYLFDSLNIKKAKKILDVGCGSGFTSNICSNKVGKKGTVVCADISMPLLTLLKQKYKKVKNLKPVHTDIESYKFNENYFDHVVSRFGVMFFDNPVVAFSNIYKSLKKDGEFTFVCWNDFNSNEFFSIPAHIVCKFLNVNMPVLDNSPGPFSLNKKKHIVNLLEKSNFRKIRIRNIKTYLKTSNVHIDTNIMLNIGTGAKMLAEANVSVNKKKMIKKKLVSSLENNIFNKSLLYKANFLIVKAVK